MMGSGKTTVGKILSGVLGYSFFDWFALILSRQYILTLKGIWMMGIIKRNMLWNQSYVKCLIWGIQLSKNVGNLMK